MKNNQTNNQQDLFKLAFYNSETGLPNSTKLIDDLRTLGGEKDSVMPALICMQIPFRETFVGFYGRKYWTALLLQIGAWLKEQAGEGNELYQLSKDQLCLALDGGTDMDASLLAHYIYNRFLEPWQIQIGGAPQFYTCSAWVCVLRPGKDFIEKDLLELIDQTLYYAQKHRNVFVDDAMLDQVTLKNRRMEQSLADCIRDGMRGFSVLYQPVVACHSGVWHGVEALCRWKSPELGDICMDILVPKIQQLGLVSTFGDWVLETAMQTCKDLELDQIESFMLTVNISPIQLMDSEFAGRVGALLEKTEYPRARLCLEITQSNALLWTDSIAQALERLCAHGVRIALDDLEYSYEFFSRMGNLPIDYLKIDRDFIYGIDHNEHALVFLEYMSRMAKTNHITLVAKGVETRQELHLALTHGADLIQGYYFSRPLTGQQLKKQADHFQDTKDELYIPGFAASNVNKWLTRDQTQIVTPGLLELLNRCVQLLFSNVDLETAFLKVLKLVGEHFDVGRAFAFVQDENALYHNTHEWCAPGITPQQHLLQNIDLHKSTSSIAKAFQKHGILIASDIAQLPPDVVRVLDVQEIRSIVLLPFWDEGQLTGFIGFDDDSVRDWKPEEIIALWNTSMLMGNYVKKAATKTVAHDKSNFLTGVLNNNALDVFVTDMDTYEVLWVNDTLKARYSLGDRIIGSKCYEVIHGYGERCPFCKVPQLRDNPDVLQTSFEYYNEYWDRTFLIYDGMVEWTGEKQAHIEYALDVTDHKRSQQQLQYMATTDALTHVANRATVMATLKRKLQEAIHKQKKLSIAFVDVDRLKYANDTFGHVFGDQLLINVAQSLRYSIRANDVIGRLGGDEFIVLLPDCKKSLAHARMLQAREHLQNTSIEPNGTGWSFSFGVAEIGELKNQGDDEERLNDLLALADKRMQRYKNQTVPGREIS